VARILGVRPGGDRRGAFKGDLALAGEDADQGVGDGLGGRPAHDLGVDAIARSIPLGDHPAVAHHHHSLGIAIGRCGVLGEGAIERLLQRGLGGLDDRRTGDVRQQGGCRRVWRQRDRRGRLALQDQAAQRAAIDGAGLGDAGEARRHLLALAIDLVAGQEAHGREDGGDGFAVELFGLDLRDEGGGTELVADVAGRHVARAVEAAAAQERRRGAEQGERNDMAHERLS
jgi:hypothetical protein